MGQLYHIFSAADAALAQLPTLQDSFNSEQGARCVVVVLLLSPPCWEGSLLQEGPHTALWEGGEGLPREGREWQLK